MLGSVLSVAVLWFTSIPLGIPGEWTWDRVPVEPDFAWNVCGGTVAAAFFVLYVCLGNRRFGTNSHPLKSIEVTAWLLGLVVGSYLWIWIVQEVAPVKNRLGKSAFVLYYANSSGYFTRARYDEPEARKLLAGYEDLMRQGDVLHTGTHPPGLFLAFHGLLAACEASPALSSFLDATQPASFREATDVIASNNLRRRVPRPLMPLDKRVLWLATLLVLSSASLTVLPLFGLLRRTCSLQIAWLGASLWPSLPALAIFIPKSDALFPLIGLCLLWCWLTAWDNRSLVLSAVSGLIAWLGLICSLAFMPVLVQAFLLSVVATTVFPAIIPPSEATFEDGRRRLFSQIDIRRLLCITAAVLGFVGPTFLMWFTVKINLFQVWWLNYHNHAGFYEQYPRTYVKWLLVNPVELLFSAGWPIAFLSASICLSTCLDLYRKVAVYWNQSKQIAPHLDQRKAINTSSVVVSTMLVWGLLWMTGKNSGEAARLWIIFLPWLVWLAGIQLGRLTEGDLTSTRIVRTIVFLLMTQFLVSLLTVSRVSGFHSESG